jgi:hypothetical protein
MNWNDARTEMESNGTPPLVMGYCKIAFDLGASRWIPVSEQLPDSDTTVMTFAPDSNEPIWPAYHDGNQWVDFVGSPINDGIITHWMEFPEPPEA